MSDYLGDDAISMYCESYKEAFLKSSRLSFSGKKKEAKNVANSIFPELARALNAMTISSVYPDRFDENDRELVDIGYKLVAALRKINIKGFYLSNNGKIREKKSKQPKERDGTKSTPYQSWVDTHDFVAGDILLAHFCNTTSAAIGAIRFRLRQQGYEFSQVDNGWRVDKRPAKTGVTLEQLLDKVSKEDLLNYLMKKLK